MHIPAAILLTAAVAAASQGGSAQTSKQFRARLSPVPIDLTMQNVIAGSGTATATLAGNKLTVNGTFADLKSPATVAHIHVAPKGMSGPAQLDLQVKPGTSGTITGSFELTPAQLQDLTNQRFYIQLHSEKAPDGNLRGWLLPQEARR